MSWLKRLWLPAVLLLSLLCSGIALAIPTQFSSVTVQSIVHNPTDVIIPPPPTTTQPSQTISGSSQPKTTIQIINNDRVVAQIQTNAEGSFSVPVPLQLGRNRLAVQGADGKLSAPVTVTRVPLWWQHWGRTVTTTAGISVMLVLMGLIVKLLVGGAAAAL